MKLDSDFSKDLVLVGFTVELTGKNQKNFLGDTIFTGAKIIDAIFVKISKGKIYKLPIDDFLNNIDIFRFMSSPNISKHYIFRCINNKPIMVIQSSGYILYGGDNADYWFRDVNGKNLYGSEPYGSDELKLSIFDSTGKNIGANKNSKKYYIVKNNEFCYSKIDTSTLKTEFVDRPLISEGDDFKSKCCYLETCIQCSNGYMPTHVSRIILDGVIYTVGNKEYIVDTYRGDILEIPESISELIVYEKWHIGYPKTLVIKNPKLTISIFENMEKHLESVNTYYGVKNRRSANIKLREVVVTKKMTCATLRKCLFELLKFDYFDMSYYNDREHILNQLRLAKNYNVLRDLLAQHFKISLVLV